MRPIDFYLVDAFAESTFEGNAAAVCPLTEWLPDETLLKMSKQHNQSETAFFVTTDAGFELRWFTTQHEIDLCGHATLAAAHVIFEYLDYPDPVIRFDTRYVGQLTVSRSGEWLTMDFPAWPTEPVMALPLLLETLGLSECKEVRVARDYMVVLENQQQVEAVKADVNAMIPLEKMVCITAPGEGEYDFVSRFFCPGESVPEDPVTGSTHSMLIPYWAEKLGKTQMLARQVSGRGGDLRCQLEGDRVRIGGKAATYLVGKVLLR
ncbi:PhzF family phenazine biosynthesis protein [Enterobacteriaceae bacterium H11S18]|uniref:PhzF family phenazine biosynthesis protein n=1 Tax=Dryocola clanedunensis TaxID=2925396 RepID=UPI0022F0B631|nr:PhzF family phenazine biosynthesis protein [Dryocola clanedunensis]MCT4706513.1 PhzF family phenazine biosynthesis protein [Dryocola clanedunensis]MCT4713324.1 PhzF family phenazine biosynthesis protein [Dryocola clanedunensis]